jgi:hypothetical protein
MRDRRPDVQFQIERLERRHGQLEAQVAGLERRLFLSGGDQLRVRSLKKEKLAAKDALADLRRMQ